MSVSIRRVVVGTALTLGVTSSLLMVSTGPASAATAAQVKVKGSLTMRTAPSTTAQAVGTLRNRAKITIGCRVTGQYVRGTVRRTAQWDRLTSGAYIPHAYVSTRGAIEVCPPPPPAQPALARSAAPEPAGSMTRTQFIAAVSVLAQDNQREFRIPASVTIAQAILESGWGASRLTANDRNFFGMKCFDRGTIAVGCHVYVTSECDDQGSCFRTEASFRVYASALASFRDHGKLLSTSQRYSPAFAYTNDADRFIAAVHRAGYATSPTYASSVQNIMRTYNLYQYNVN